MESNIKTIVIECSDIMLNGIVSCLSNKPDIRVVGHTSKISQISELIKKEKHDLVLLGPMMNDIYGEDISGAIKNKYPEVRVACINYDDYPSNIDDRIKETLS